MPSATTSALAGKRVVVTRAVQQSSELFERLTALGAIAFALPLVSFAPPEDFAALDAALRQWQSFDWIIFTSANAVQAIASRLKQDSRETVILRASDKDARRTSAPTQPPTLPFVVGSPQIAAVGPATTEAAKNAGFSVTYTAKTHLGVGLAHELGDGLRNKSVFLPRSDRANPDLPAALRELGAKLTEVVAYRTLPPTDTDKDAVATAINQQSQAVIFFSPSAAHNLIDLLGRDALSAIQNRVALAAVGPVTAAALRDAGVNRIIIAADTTSAAVVEALQSHFTAQSRAQHP